MVKMRQIACLRRGGDLFPLQRGKTTLGREDCDIVVRNRTVAMKHAVIERLHNGIYIVKDMNTTNGTFVNDRRVQDASLSLSHGDTVRFGYEHPSHRFEILSQEEYERLVDTQEQEDLSEDSGNDNNAKHHASDCYREGRRRLFASPVPPDQVDAYGNDSGENSVISSYFSDGEYGIECSQDNCIRRSGRGGPCRHHYRCHRHRHRDKGLRNGEALERNKFNGRGTGEEYYDGCATTTLRGEKERLPNLEPGQYYCHSRNLEDYIHLKRPKSARRPTTPPPDAFRQSRRSQHHHHRKLRFVDNSQPETRKCCPSSGANNGDLRFSPPSSRRPMGSGLRQLSKVPLGDESWSQSEGLEVPSYGQSMQSSIDGDMGYVGRGSTISDSLFAENVTGESDGYSSDPFSGRSRERGRDYSGNISSTKTIKRLLKRQLGDKYNIKKAEMELENFLIKKKNEEAMKKAVDKLKSKTQNTRKAQNECTSSLRKLSDHFEKVVSSLLSILHSFHLRYDDSAGTSQAILDMINSRFADSEKQAKDGLKGLESSKFSDVVGTIRQSKAKIKALEKICQLIDLHSAMNAKQDLNSCKLVVEEQQNTIEKLSQKLSNLQDEVDSQQSNAGNDLLSHEASLKQHQTALLELRQQHNECQRVIALQRDEIIRANSTLKEFENYKAVAEQKGNIVVTLQRQIHKLEEEEKVRESVVHNIREDLKQRKREIEELTQYKSSDHGERIQALTKEIEGLKIKVHQKNEELEDISDKLSEVSRKSSEKVRKLEEENIHEKQIMQEKYEGELENIQNKLESEFEVYKVETKSTIEELQMQAQKERDIVISIAEKKESIESELEKEKVKKEDMLRELDTLLKKTEKILNEMNEQKELHERKIEESERLLGELSIKASEREEELAQEVKLWKENHDKIKSAKDDLDEKMVTLQNISNCKQSDFEKSLTEKEKIIDTLSSSLQAAKELSSHILRGDAGKITPKSSNSMNGDSKSSLLDPVVNLSPKDSAQSELLSCSVSKEGTLDLPQPNAGELLDMLKAKDSQIASLTMIINERETKSAMTPNNASPKETYSKVDQRRRSGCKCAHFRRSISHLVRIVNESGAISSSESELSPSNEELYVSNSVSEGDEFDESGKEESLLKQQVHYVCKENVSLKGERFRLRSRIMQNSSELKTAKSLYEAEIAELKRKLKYASSQKKTNKKSLVKEIIKGHNIIEEKKAIRQSRESSPVRMARFICDEQCRWKKKYCELAEQLREILMMDPEEVQVNDDSNLDFATSAQALMDLVMETPQSCKVGEHQVEQGMKQATTQNDTNEELHEKDEKLRQNMELVKLLEKDLRTLGSENEELMKEKLSLEKRIDAFRHLLDENEILLSERETLKQTITMLEIQNQRLEVIEAAVDQKGIDTKVDSVGINSISVTGENSTDTSSPSNSGMRPGSDFDLLNEELPVGHSYHKFGCKSLSHDLLLEQVSCVTSSCKSMNTSNSKLPLQENCNTSLTGTCSKGEEAPNPITLLSKPASNDLLEASIDQGSSL